MGISKRGLLARLVLFLFPSVSSALRLPQAIMRSRSIVAAVRVDS